MRMQIAVIAVSSLAVAGATAACPFRVEANRPVVLADNAATSTPAPSGKAPDAAAYPNSPNGSPAAGDKGAPVVTDKAACAGQTGATPCPDSPPPSTKADTSDTKIGTPTTVNGKPTAN